MIYRILADTVVLLHFLFILFVVAGGLLVLRRRWLALLHLPAVVWGVYIEFSGDLCPLTPLENTFNRLAGRQGYASGFIQHYLIPVIYPAGLTHQIQLVLGLLAGIVNLVPYVILVCRVVHRMKEKRPSALK